MASEMVSAERARELMIEKQRENAISKLRNAIELNGSSFRLAEGTHKSILDEFESKGYIVTKHSEKFDRHQISYYMVAI